MRLSYSEIEGTLGNGNSSRRVEEVVQSVPQLTVQEQANDIRPQDPIPQADHQHKVPAHGKCYQIRILLVKLASCICVPCLIFVNVLSIVEERQASHIGL